MRLLSGSRRYRWIFVTALLMASLTTYEFVPFRLGQDEPSQGHRQSAQAIALGSARADEPLPPRNGNSEAGSGNSPTAPRAEDPDKDASLPRAGRSDEDKRALTLPLLLLSFISSLPFGPFK